MYKQERQMYTCSCVRILCETGRATQRAGISKCACVRTCMCLCKCVLYTSFIISALLISNFSVVHNALYIFKQLFTNVTESVRFDLMYGSHSQRTHLQIQIDVLTYNSVYHISLNRFLFIDLNTR